MKPLSVFLVVLVGVQSSEVLNSFMEQSDVFLELFRDIARDVLSEDGSIDFQPHIKSRLDMVESQVCPDEGNQCEPWKNWLLGCSCKAEFDALEGSCSNNLCQMVRGIKEDGPKALSDFISASSYEEIYAIVMDQVEKVWRILCKCRRVVDASIGCVRNYDGKVFDITGIDRSEFDNIVTHLDWDTIREILHGYLDAICGEENGEDCLTVFKSWQTLGGVFFDNTVSGIDSCLSLLRVEEEVEEYLVSQAFEEGMDFKFFYDRMVDAYMKMEYKIICGAGCVKEMQEALYSSCCVKRAGEMLSSESMKEKYLKLFKNIWPFFGTGEAPDLKDAIDRFFSMYRPASFCGDKTDVYKRKVEECDAMKA